ncbi:hypothetical protein DFJ74DRAFT_654644 [Hyaloraphidium curvatum]|nr:hypothetical protein DFJ74DRAFT_654644 [Hyaloraphidium curvatum]
MRECALIGHYIPAHMETMHHEGRCPVAGHGRLQGYRCPFAVQAEEPLVCRKCRPADPSLSRRGFHLLGRGECDTSHNVYSHLMGEAHCARKHFRCFACGTLHTTKNCFATHAKGKEHRRKMEPLVGVFAQGKEAEANKGHEDAFEADPFDADALEANDADQSDEAMHGYDENVHIKVEGLAGPDDANFDKSPAPGFPALFAPTAPQACGLDFAGAGAFRAFLDALGQPGPAALPEPVRKQPQGEDIVTQEDLQRALDNILSQHAALALPPHDLDVGFALIPDAGLPAPFPPAFFAPHPKYATRSWEAMAYGEVQPLLRTAHQAAPISPPPDRAPLPDAPPGSPAAFPAPLPGYDPDLWHCLIPPDMPEDAIQGYFAALMAPVEVPADSEPDFDLYP